MVRALFHRRVERIDPRRLALGRGEVVSQVGVGGGVAMAEGASAGVAHDTGDTAQGAGDAGSVAVTGRLADVDDERLCTGYVPGWCTSVTSVSNE